MPLYGVLMELDNPTVRNIVQHVVREDVAKRLLASIPLTMCLFLFVVMVLNVPREDAAEWDRSHPLFRPMAMRIGAALALLLTIELGWALSRTPGLTAAIGEDRPAVSSLAELGRVLFTKYMFAFEVTSVLIIAAMVGAVVLARKRED